MAGIVAAYDVGTEVAQGSGAQAKTVFTFNCLSSTAFETSFSVS